jgi:hypothetical protein
MITILIISALVMGLATLLLLCLPLVFEVTADGKGLLWQFNITASWLHRSCIRFDFNYPDGSPAVTLASRFKFPRTQLPPDPEPIQNRPVATIDARPSAVDSRPETAPPTRSPADTAPTRTASTDTVNDTVNAESDAVLKKEAVTKESPAEPGWLDRLKRSKALFVLRQGCWLHKALSWLLHSIKRMRTLVVFERCALACKAGGITPSLSGTIYGIVLSIQHALALNTQHRFFIRFEPLFDTESTLEIAGNIKIRTSVGRLLYPFFMAVVTLPYLATFLLWRRMRKRERT